MCINVVLVLVLLLISLPISACDRHSRASLREQRRLARRPNHVGTPGEQECFLAPKDDSLLLRDPNEDAAPYDCSQQLSFLTSGDKVEQTTLTFLGFDDLFPGTSFGEVFDNSADFRHDLRMAARKDFSITNVGQADTTKKKKMRDSGKDSMMRFWLNAEKELQISSFPTMTEVFKKYLPAPASITGEQFVSALTELCGEACFGSWMDIVGIREKPLTHAWHQDSGLDHLTVMVGFPMSNNYEGLGVFSHAVPLSMRLKAPSKKATGPRTWPVDELIDDPTRRGQPQSSREIKALQFDESHVIRPVYRKGKEILIYNDADIFHSAPDYARRESLWRFM